MAAPIEHARGEVNSAVVTLPLTGLSNVVAYPCRHCAPWIGVIVTQVAIAAGERARSSLSRLPARPGACRAVTGESAPDTVRKNYLARRSGPAWCRSGSARKTTQYLVDRFLRCLHADGHERVARPRRGIANEINKQCTAACLTSHNGGHISAPPRWGAGSRRKPRRSLTTRTATSQAILAAEFYSRGRCALAAMPVHSLCADARHGWTRDGDKETGSRCRPLTS